MKRYNFFRIILIAFMIFLKIPNINGQISQGGSPPSFKSEIVSELTPTDNTEMKNELTPLGKVDKKVLPPVNVDSMKKEDSIEQAQPKPVPPRFGKKMKVDLGIENAGTWDTLANGNKIWRIRIHSPGAKSLNFIFDEFKLPEGAELYLYNEQKKHLKGAFTSANNKPSGIFATDVIPGDKVFLEYKLPHDIETKGELKLESITHGYKEVYLEETDHGESGNCHVDANCQQGDGWCLQKKSVALIIVDGNRLATGNLINNVEQDGTPFFLTAYHNSFFGNDDFDEWVFRFRYYDTDPSCPQDSDDAEEPHQFFSISGSEYRAHSDSTDFLLLELDNAPPAEVAYYAGWTRENDENNHPNHVTKFSHPATDLMKLGVGNDIGIGSSNAAGVPYHPECCWDVSFYDGISEPGSSGAGLFNDDHLLIGFISEADPDLDCGNPHESIFFGRFDLSWDRGLSEYLDPNNTDQMSVDGFSCCIEKSLYQNTTDIPEFTSVEDYIKAGEDVGLANAGTGPTVVEGGEYAEFQAGNEIELKEGFRVQENGEFSAVLKEPCNQNEGNCFEDQELASPPTVFKICCDNEDRFCFPVEGATYFQVDIYDMAGNHILYNQGKVEGNYVCLFELNNCWPEGAYTFEVTLYGCNYSDWSKSAEVSVQHKTCKRSDFLSDKAQNYDNNDKEAFNHTVFPNPFKNQVNFTINILKSSEGDLKIFDAGGKLIKEKKFNLSSEENTLQVSTDDLPKGVYFYNIYTSDHHFHGKILKKSR